MHGYNPLTNYTCEDGLISNLSESCVEDKNCNILFAVDEAISKLNRNIKSRFGPNYFINYRTKQRLVNNNVSGILGDKNTNFWFATYGGGVSRFLLNPCLQAMGNLLKKFLLAIHKKLVEEQKQMRSPAIERGKGNLEQVDDVLLMVIKM